MMESLLAEVRRCTICSATLPNDSNPIVVASAQAVILIIGQAPGRKVDSTGIPWDDPSGDELRRWLSVSKDDFYDSSKISLVPMGFCYPGKGRSGDLPPRPECAPKWHDRLLHEMRGVRLTMLIGQYAQRYYLREAFMGNLTETVRAFDQFLPAYLPLPHPSPRNRIWMKKNQWFEEGVIPILRAKTAELLASS